MKIAHDIRRYKVNLVIETHELRTLGIILTFIAKKR